MNFETLGQAQAGSSLSIAHLTFAALHTTQNVELFLLNEECNIDMKIDGGGGPDLFLLSECSTSRLICPQRNRKNQPPTAPPDKPSVFLCVITNSTSEGNEFSLFL